MMSTVHVLKANGDEHEITFSTLAHWLADERSYPDVLLDLCRSGTATADIKSGDDGADREPAELRYISPKATRRQAEQAELVFRPGRGHNYRPDDYDAEVELFFNLPARVSCQATSPSDAARLIRRVVAGHMPAPAGFEFVINGDTIRNFFHRIERVTAMGIPLGIRDVNVNRVSQRLLLEGGGS